MLRTSAVLVLVIFCVAMATGRSVVKRSVKSHQDQEKFFRDFGYLGEGSPLSDKAALSHMTHEQAFTQAVKAFQKMAGLTITGEVDDATLAKMNEPRCGVKDIVQPEGTDGYVLHGSKWDDTSLTYKYLDFTKDLETPVVKSEIEKAFKVWEDESSLKFTETSGTADIDIRFTSVDGPGNTLAYAYYPAYGGDVTMDDDEDFTSGTNEGINLLQVAAHEFGHSLGLAHSDVQSALMAPYYTGYQADFKLDQDDVDAIKQLYPPMLDIDVCQDASFDAWTYYKGELYAFKDNFVVKNKNDQLVSGWPKLISQTVFKDLPNNLDAALYWPDSYGTYSGTYFFKGSQYWRYGDEGLLPGYPKLIRDDFVGLPDNIDAAVVWSGNDRTYFFKGDAYYRITPGVGVDVGYPYSLSGSWHGLPAGVDAALQWENGKTYFFKGTQYYRYNDEQDKVDDQYPLDTNYMWFGCTN